MCALLYVIHQWKCIKKMTDFLPRVQLVPEKAPMCEPPSVEVWLLHCSPFYLPSPARLSLPKFSHQDSHTCPWLPQNSGRILVLQVVLSKPSPHLLVQVGVGQAPLPRGWGIHKDLMTKTFLLWTSLQSGCLLIFYCFCTSGKSFHLFIFQYHEVNFSQQVNQSFAVRHKCSSLFCGRIFQNIVGGVFCWLFLEKWDLSKPDICQHKSGLPCLLHTWGPLDSSLIISGGEFQSSFSQVVLEFRPPGLRLARLLDLQPHHLTLQRIYAWLI